MSLVAIADKDLPADLARDVLEGLARLHQTVLVLDRQGHVVWHKDSAGLLSKLPRGATPCSIAGRLFDPDRCAELRDLVSARGQIVNERVQLLLAGGEVIPVELSLTRLGDSDGPHLVALLRPLADRERRDQQLRHTIEYLGAILDAAPEAVLAVDRNGFVTYANPAIERLLGYAAEETVDKPISVYVRNTVELDRIAAVLRPGAESFVHDIDLRRKDEALLRVSVSASGLRLPDGTQAGAVLVLHDVTERRRFEAELSRKNDDLEHCVNTLAHDLRSPLVALLGFSRLLRQDYGARLDDTGLHFVDRIEQAGRTMETLIHDLLELSRIGSRGNGGAGRPARVLQHLHAELKPRLDAAGVDLVLPASPPLVYCDRTRLYQVFSNLIGNAIEHMGPCAEPRIVVDVVEEADCEHITVLDSGRGIAPEDHARIFEVFQSLGPRRDDRSGTGIGLAIVKKIAQTHGGQAWVESRLGHGSTFHVTFPRR